MPLDLCYNVTTLDLCNLLEATFHYHLLPIIYAWNAIRKESQTPEAPLLLALTVYGEARGEPLAGQCAVIDVIVNRARRRRTPNIDDIMLHAFQFSSLNKGNHSLNEASQAGEQLITHWLRFADTAFRAIYSGTWVPEVPEATLYCTEDALQQQLRRWLRYEKPHWDFSKIHPAGYIGNHYFFEEA